MRVPHPPPLIERVADVPPEFNDLPQDIIQRGLEEMRFLIDFVNQRRNERYMVNAM